MRPSANDPPRLEYAASGRPGDTPGGPINKPAKDDQGRGTEGTGPCPGRHVADHPIAITTRTSDGTDDRSWSTRASTAIGKGPSHQALYARRTWVGKSQGKRGPTRSDRGGS